MEDLTTVVVGSAVGLVSTGALVVGTKVLVVP